MKGRFQKPDKDRQGKQGGPLSKSRTSLDRRLALFSVVREWNDRIARERGGK